MDSIAEKMIVPNILAKLPTRDVARCRCVCRQWRRIVADPSFRSLHGADASGGGAMHSQSLLVYEIRGRANVDMLVLNSPSSARIMCRVTNLFTVAGYSPSNACNGFLLFGPRLHEWPVCVCNPVTGETLLLPEAPAVQDEVSSCIYALGFSPSTLLYKLFRLSFLPSGCYMEVRTLGDVDQPWRRQPDPLPCRAVSPSPPALLGEKIYFTCDHGILVIDVATEAHCTYSLPKYEGENVEALAFKLRGRLCIAVHVITQHKLDFWVLPQLHLTKEKKDGRTVLDWEPRYSFHMNHDGETNGGEEEMRGAGLNDRDGMLFYKMNGRLYKYDTTKNDHHLQVGALLEWDNITQLPNKERWNVYGGYRPSLDTPNILLDSLDHLASLKRHKEFEDTLLAAFRDRKSSKKPRF